jgi:hypothetical protein
MTSDARRHKAFVSCCPLASGTKGRASRTRRTVTLASGKARAASPITCTSSASTASENSSGTIRRSRRKVTRSGTTLVLIPPLISPTVSCGLPIPSIPERRSASDFRQA